MRLNKNELKELLYCQELIHIKDKHTGFIKIKSYFSEKMFELFFDLYKKENDLNNNHIKEVSEISKRVKILIKDYNENKRFFRTDEQEINDFYTELSELFYELPKPIDWYSDNFWSLFNFKLSNKCENDWKEMESIRFVSENYEKNLASFLWKNKQPNLFENLNDYFFKIKFPATKIINVYHKLAVKNKKVLITQSPSMDLIEQLDLYISLEKLGHLKVCEILSLFKLDSVKDRIIGLYEEKKGDVVSSRQIEKILEDLGVDTEVYDNSPLIIEESRKLPVIDKKILSLKKIVGKKKVNKSMIYQFQDLLHNILNHELRCYCSSTIVLLNENYYLPDNKSPIMVLEVEIKTDYNLNHDRSYPLFNQIIEYYTGDFFKNKFMIYLTNSLQYKSKKEDLINEFSEDLKKIILKARLDNSINESEAKKIRKNKI